MAEIIAIGTLIGAKIAAAATAAAGWTAAHAGALTAAAAIASAGTAIVGGVQKYKSGKLQARQLEMQGQAERTQTAIENEERQKRLRRTLAMQNAIFGSSNVSISDGSPSIIAGDTYNEAERQTNQASLMSEGRLSVIGLQRDDALMTGRYGLYGGILGGAASLIGAAAGYGQTGKIPTPPKAPAPRRPPIPAPPAPPPTPKLPPPRTGNTSYGRGFA